MNKYCLCVLFLLHLLNLIDQASIRALICLSRYGDDLTICAFAIDIICGVCSLSAFDSKYGRPNDSEFGVRHLGTYVLNTKSITRIYNANI